MIWKSPLVPLVVGGIAAGAKNRNLGHLRSLRSGSSQLGKNAVWTRRTRKAPAESYPARREPLQLRSGHVRRWREQTLRDEVDCHSSPCVVSAEYPLHGYADDSRTYYILGVGFDTREAAEIVQVSVAQEFFAQPGGSTSNHHIW